MSVARFAFGPRLKAHRERQGVTLLDIAESTKISIALLSSLERNDLSQWPKGIFRRAFLRSYTRAIDIPFEPAWAEFVQLFPEEGAAPAASPVAQTPELRLTFAARASLFRSPSYRSVIATVVDIALVVLFGMGISALGGISPWLTIALTGWVYSVACTLFIGESLTLRCLPTRRTLRSRELDDVPDVAPERELDIPALRVAVEQLSDAAVTSTPLPRRRLFTVHPSPTPAATETRERRVADR